MLAPDQVLTSRILSEMYGKSNQTTDDEPHEPIPNYILEEVNGELRRALGTAEGTLAREIDNHAKDMEMTEQKLSERDAQICELKQELKEHRSCVVCNITSLWIVANATRLGA